MKGAVPRGGSVVADHRENPRWLRKRAVTRCAICTRRIWFNAIHLTEPEGVPEPRLSWALCKHCYGALLAEMERSPVRSPLRLRIAMGIVAAERWPEAYPSKVSMYMSDRRWVVFIAVGFAVAMLLHLVLVVMVAAMR